MHTMTAQALAAKLAAPREFTIGELAIIASAFGVKADELIGALR